MIKTIWTDPETHEEYSYDWGFPVDTEIPRSKKKKTSTTKPNLPKIKKVIFNDPATIVFWDDGTKTVVKVQEQHGDKFDPEKGIVMAIAKKGYGNKGSYYNEINKWIIKCHETVSKKKGDMNEMPEMQK